MLLVVADTSPIFYLLSIDHIDLLQRLFGKVIVPDAVHTELCHPAAPEVVRELGGASACLGTGYACRNS
jgi:predicted nucleic acid-binding protein